MTPDPRPAIAAGLAVFPLPPGGRRPEPGWQQLAGRDLTNWPAGANIGVGCRASDVVGVDLDRHPGQADGVLRFAHLCQQHDGWPDTLTVATPSGGIHLYFRAAGRPIISTSGARSPLGPGIDTRGPGRRTGGYLIGPGSIVAGRAYTISHSRAIADLPAWLAVLLEETPTRH